ncbi:MAG: cryptochrome/photolyase family protein [Fimbriimonadaceae bacterium]|nr:cryptochrome/photolyase family protein [Fimbriimonadaceae bacterium]
MRVGTLILGDQLFPDRSRLSARGRVFMREDMGLATRVRHHQQKLVLFFSAMRHYADALRSEGYQVTYETLGEGRESFEDALSHWVTHQRVTHLHVYEPADEFFTATLEFVATATSARIVTMPNPGFISNEADWRSFRERKRLLMADFYRAQRIKTRYLMEDGQPRGGRWSFDAENRRTIPKGVHPPTIDVVKPDDTTKEVIGLVSERFSNHPGDAKEFAYAVDRQGALAWLESFLEERFGGFGPYEDAMAKDEVFLWHSVLTPYLNSGLLSPKEVIDRAIAKFQQGGIPIESAEGFIRQILGWREFIRGMDREYRIRGLKSGNWPNSFGGHRKLAPSWYDGTTGLLPLDTVIQRVQRYAYCHHIERLMVIGAAMLMSEVDPEEAYRWFMEMFIDSADWVMRPNVMGMSLFADGGLFATKPYFSGSAYLRRMGDWPSGEWCEVWDGLYWRFIAKNREFFSQNPRMSAIARGVDRLDSIRRDRIFAAAEAFISSATLEE